MNSWGVFDMALWPQATPIVYEFDPFGSLKAFQIVNNQINSTILSQTPAMPSLYSGVSLSANGTQSGIVWLTTGDFNANGVPGTLHALDATNLAKEFWNSDLTGHDTLGGLAKFAPPTVANGRVYVPTFSNTVAVYGVLGSGVAPGSGTISSVLNGASFLDGPLSPGELVTIFGANLGPDVDHGLELDGDHISDNVQGTGVTFSGIPAPLLFTSSSQINAVVPFGVAGPTTKVQVTYQGTAVASTTVPVQAASPAVFALDGSGGGQGAILNADGSVNTSDNPAARGSVVVLFATGGGVTTPASQDGFLTTAPYPAPELPVSVTIDGLPAKVIYAGAAPGLVAGVMQINVVTPEGADPEPFEQVVVTIGNYSSPSAVTVSLK